MKKNNKKEKKEQVNIEKSSKEKSLKKIEKEEKTNKILQRMKKSWLLDGTTTLALVIIIVVGFILINLGMQKLELAPLDFTQEKLYTLTDESKERVKNIDKDINMYFIGYLSLIHI